MPHVLLLAIVVASGLDDPASIESVNATYRSVREDGLTAGEAVVKLPAPLLSGHEEADAERAKLRELAGSSRALDEFLRDSVTAPHILRLRDEPGDEAILRAADLWFVLRTELDQVDPEEAARRSDGRVVEAANMRVESQLVELHAAQGDGQPATWTVRLEGTLLDRIGFEVTERAEATRLKDAVVVASRCEPGVEGTNRWFAIEGGRSGEPQPYRGGISYVVARPLATVPGALLVEAHFAFVEPRGWFRGAPVLRSKFSVIAQDQIRSLRRELARDRKSP